MFNGSNRLTTVRCFSEFGTLEMKFKLMQQDDSCDRAEHTKQNKDMAPMHSIEVRRKACRAAVCVVTEAAGIESYIIQARSRKIYCCADAVSGLKYQKQNYVGSSLAIKTLHKSIDDFFFFYSFVN